jgi:TonB-linked SusC/RagA family outer membrane protein
MKKNDPKQRHREWAMLKKMLIIMKITTVLFFIALFQVSAKSYSQETKLSLKFERETLESAFSKIEASSEFSIFYKNELIKNSQKISGDFKDAAIFEILDQILKPADLTYTIKDKLIMIIPKDFVPEKTETPQSERRVTGKVTDQAGMAIPGASIIIKGTTIGTVTDTNGNFSITNVTEKNILVCSFIGMKSQEIAIGNKATVAFSLTDESVGIEEVAVIGYGSVKRRDLTGAVGSIKAAEIVRSNPSNPTQALQGQVPGVLVTKLSNKPGGLWSIAIRGENTITADPNADGTKNLTLTSSTQQSQGTEPLVVIDGVIGGKLMDINPADIESIDILKDASSTAIYGSRGANGVVIITSKRGLSGKPRVTFDSYVGIKTPAHLPRMQNAQEFYKSTITDAQLNGSSITEANTFNVNELNIINNGRSTDIVRELTKPGMSTGSTLAISGGNNATTYRISGGYIDEDGMTNLTYYKKYNVNASIDSKITKFLKVGVTIYENFSTNPTGSLEILRTAYRSRPTVTLYYKDLVDPAIGGDAAIGPIDGYAVKMGRNDTMNPLLEASSKSNYVWTRNVSSQMGNAYAEINLFRGLTFKSSISASYQLAKQDEYRGKYSKSVNLGANTRASVENDYIAAYTFDNQLSYNYQKGKSKLSATALQSAFKTTTEMNVISVTGLPYVSYWYNLSSASSTPTIGSAYYQRTMDSYMGRVNYTFNDKFLFTLTGRADGASQLAEGHKWAFFPSGAFAWRMADERFIKKIAAISDLKLRVSYGQVGNSVVSPYSTTATLLTTNYGFGSAAGIGFAPNNLGNKGLGWERSQELNLGLNLGLFKNRITAAIEVYSRTTKDLIMKEALPTASGFNTITANVGRVSNKGVELLLNTVNVASKSVTWTTAINFAKNVNKLEALPNGAQFGWSGSTNPENVLAVGQPLKSFLYFQADGIWQLKDSVLAKSFGALPGQVRIVDQNKDGKITSGVVGKDDRVILGSQLPKFTVGMTNRVSYKNFDLSVMMYYRNGTMFKNGFLSGYVADAGGGGRLALNYWTRKNPSNEMYGMGISANNFRDAIYYEDASFLRISDVTLGYTIPRAKLEKLAIDRVRVYLQVVNPAYFTKFHGGDPEYNGAAYQDDVPSETFTFGFNLAF